MMSSIFHRISVRKFEGQTDRERKNRAGFKSRDAGAECVQPAAMGVLCSDR